MLWWYSLRKDQSFGPHRCDVCHLRMTWLWLNQLPQLLYTLEELVLKVLQKNANPLRLVGFSLFFSVFLSLLFLLLLQGPPAAWKLLIFYSYHHLRGGGNYFPTSPTRREEAVNGIEVVAVMSLCYSNTQLRITCLIFPQQLSFSGRSDYYFFCRGFIVAKLKVDPIINCIC